MYKQSYAYSIKTEKNIRNQKTDFPTRKLLLIRAGKAVLVWVRSGIYHN